MEKTNQLENDEDPLRPQAGPQEDFCACAADICIYGSGAGTGKSFGLLLESSRNIDHPNYNGMIFRRTYPQITSGGGLWDTSRKVYPRMGGKDNSTDLTYKFQSGSFIKFGHMQHEKNMFDHQGAAYPFLGFDELTHFSRKMFFYLLTRNRAPAGYDRPCYCRATTNPEPGWVADLIAWWWDPATGYAIKERSGILRYFIVINDEVVWVDKGHRDKRGNAPLSLTFIPATLDDNPALKKADPRYEANLLAQDHVTRERLLHGNWKISYAGGMFNPEWFKIIDASEVPEEIRSCRYWDFAASEVKEGKDPDWTAGVKSGISGGDFYVLDVSRFREAPGATEKRLLALAKQDGRNVAIAWEEEKGSAGKFNTHHMTGKLLGYELHPDPVVGDKIERAKPLASTAEHGHVYLVRGAWNAQFLAEAGAFPLGTRDVIDACFSSGTMIATPFGNKRIEKIKKGDFVLTPLGVKVVKRTYSNIVEPRNVCVWNRSIATLSHPVFASGKFRRIDSLHGEMKFSILSISEVLIWRIHELFMAAENTFCLEGKEGIITLNTKRTTGVKPALRDFIYRCGKMPITKSFPMATLFIIRILTLLITIPAILSAYHFGCMLGCVLECVVIPKDYILNLLGRLRRCGMLQKKGSSGTNYTGQIGGKKENLLLKNACSVVLITKPCLSTPNQDIAHKNVPIDIELKIIKQPIRRASGVERSFRQELLEKKLVHFAPINVECLGRGDVEKIKTYNLEICGPHCYYANGVLVGNCDGALKVLTTTKRVWPMFSAGQAREFAINVQKIGERDFHYGAIVQLRDMSIRFLCAVWDSKKGNLWVYGSGRCDDAMADTVAVDMIKKMQMRTARITRIVGNDQVFSGDGRNVASYLRAALRSSGVAQGIVEPPMFDLYGASMYANALFAAGNIAVHKTMVEPAAEFAEWAFDDSGRKPKDGYGFCIALCLIVSELKRDQDQLAKRPKMVDYRTREAKKEQVQESWQTA
jgi:predicted phage terminase large subunit-like protein